MKVLLILIVFVMFVFFVGNPVFRSALLHPVNTCYWAFRDVYLYFKHKKYNCFTGYGKIVSFVSSTSQAFGCGKTLTMVSYVKQIYNRYNDKFVYDEEKGIFVKQHIRIISNVDFVGIPYIPFSSINQFARIEEYFREPCFPYDEPFQPQDIIIFAVDELGHVFNSRDFKENFSTETLTRMLQVRKNKILWCGTSQRWGFIDKIIRETCSVVTTCKKTWRFILLQDYDAFDLEHAVNSEMLKPLRTQVWFATDNDYHSYDTKQLVCSIKKQVDDSEFISTETILSSSGDLHSDLDTVNKRHVRGWRRPVRR